MTLSLSLALPEAYVGIDPGIKGGIALVSKQLEVLALLPMPTCLLEGKERVDAIACTQLLEDWLKSYAIQSIWIEEQRTSYAQGEANNSTRSSGSGTTMEYYGLLQGIAYGLHLEVHKVAAQTWQATYRNQTLVLPAWIDQLKLLATKKKSIGLVNLYYPELSLLPSKRAKKASDGLSDAILIARYGTNPTIKKLKTKAKAKVVATKKAAKKAA